MRSVAVVLLYIVKLKESLTSSILKIKIVKSNQNIRNKRFIKNKKHHLKYATL